MAQLPIMLMDTQHASVVREIKRLLDEDFSPIDLRELFLYLHGAKDVPANACLMVLRIRNGQELSALLPALKNVQKPLVLVSDETLSARLCNELLGLLHVTVVPSCYAEKCDTAEAVFCEHVDRDTLRSLRKNGVRMVLTKHGTLHGEVPFGIDVLYTTDSSTVSRLACGKMLDQEVATSIQLPFDETPLFSSLPLALWLGMIGADKDALHRTLAGGIWHTSYSPDEDRYTVTLESNALQCDESVMPQDFREAFEAYMQDGFYIGLQLPTAVHGLGDARQLLLCGYDKTNGTFTARTALQHGVIGRIDLLPQTLEKICLTVKKITLYQRLEELVPCEPQTFLDHLQETGGMQNGTYYGREATIRYANRFYKRFAEGEELLSADSLRIFLEERRRVGFAMWYLAKREDFYLEPFVAYLHLLADSCKKAIENLRGKTALHPDMPLFLTSELMRNLLHTEESCITAFAEEWERAQIRRVYMQSREQKMSVYENNHKNT